MPLEFAPTLRDRGAAFQQNGSQLINQRGALAHQSLQVGDLAGTQAVPIGDEDQDGVTMPVASLRPIAVKIGFTGTHIPDMDTLSMSATARGADELFDHGRCQVLANA
jgi:hypothetical protein